MKQIKNTWLRAIAGLTLAFSIGYFAVNASEKKADPKSDKALTTVTFRYYPPTGVTHPYDQMHVENTENWKAEEPACSPALNPNAPCSIVVPTANTVGGNEEEIDASLVTINTTSAGTNRFIVTAATGSQYSSPINANLP